MATTTTSTSTSATPPATTAPATPPTPKTAPSTPAPQNKPSTPPPPSPRPRGLPGAQARPIGRLAEQAFSALGCRGWARADIMLRASDQQPFLLEINTAPGMTDHSLVPMSARAAGISYEDLCLRLLAMATLDTPPGALSGAAHA